MRLQRLMRGIGGIGALCLFLASAAAAATGAGAGGAWVTEPGVNPPGYAVTEPVDGNLNVDTVVLMCDQLDGRRSLRFEIYLTGPDRLMPNGADPQKLRENPVAEISVDGRAFPTQLLFADDYALVADSAVGRQAALSDDLLDALMHGDTMVIRFGLLKAAARFDSAIVVDLAAGHDAIRNVRRCAPPAGSQQVTH